MKNEVDKRVYLVIEYLEQKTNKIKLIVVRYLNQKVLDKSTMNYESIEQVAALYYKWCSVHTKGPSESLIDIYSININTELGKLLTSILEQKMLLNNLKDTSFDVVEAYEEYTITKDRNYAYIRDIKLMKDIEEHDKREDIYDSIPIVDIGYQDTRRKTKK